MRVEIGTTDVAETPVNPAGELKKKHGWLPVLVVLFLISYALMTMLIVEQGRTIESQRVLIHELFRDSQELSAVKQKAQEEKGQESAQAQSAVEDPSSQNATTPLAQVPSNQVPSNQASSTRPQSRVAPSIQTPSTQAPSTQAPAKQAPSAQAKAQGRTQNEAAKQKQFKMPSRPASDLVDADRSLELI